MGISPGMTRGSGRRERFIKFANRLAWSPREILRVLQMNLFDRRPILDVLAPSSGPPDDPWQPQLAFA